jgi:hypothetical protein
VTDFDAARADLAAARDAQAAARLAAWQAGEVRRAVEDERARLAAEADAQEPQAAERSAEMARRAQEADAEAKQKLAEALRASEAADAALKGFERFTDPREGAGLLGDRSPIVLLPVRIETRFVTVATQETPGRVLGSGLRGVAVDTPRATRLPPTAVGEGGRRQLWVRIYPDDCSIDTFEPTLSTTEVSNAKAYWQQMWCAGGTEGDERAAWRALVAAHGSGRAGFVVDTYEPTNLADKPTKAAASDEILVIPTQAPLAAAEAGAVSTYWEAIWRADGDAAKEHAARQALDAAVGAARAAELRAGYVPFNLADVPAPPATKQHVAVSTAFVVFGPDPPPKQPSWSQAPQVRQLPERFVVLGYSNGEQVLEAIGGTVATPLYVGPDPSADPSDSIHPDGEDLVVPDELLWLVDFERAVEAGMGLAIDLTDAQWQSGFDRLLVLGVQMGVTDAGGKAALEELLHHHQVGRSGLSIVPQGTPAHNTTGSGAGHTRADDADQSFDDRRAAPLFTPTANPFEKRDGQWVAEALGIDPPLLGTVHGAGGQDQMQARAMQRALWPATLGYWMDKMLTPVFGDDTVAQTRSFFTSYVSGRGAAPALRIGGQPYGILPTTAFSRIRWLDLERPSLGLRAEPGQTFLARLLRLLREVDADWTAMSAGAAHVGRPGDAHQTLLDVVGLHPGSVEYHWRYSESLSELFNVINLWGLGPQFWQAFIALGLQAAGEGLLERLGYAGGQWPDILEHVFMTEAGRIDNVVDDRPLSETAPIRPYTDDGRNYVHWLINAASTSLDAVTGEHGFTQDASPQTLLYLYMRHALLLGYYDTSYELHKAAGFLSATDLAAMKPEPKFIHVDESAGSESRYAALYKTEPRITGNPALLVSDYIAQNLPGLGEAAGLADQLDALRVLADAPTAQLERAFAEHVDVCAYRFDAWLLALVSYQLQAMRARGAGISEPGKDGESGAYLGAYAWVEDLRRSTAPLDPVRLPPDLEQTFAGASPLLHDESNGGYIHAPSLPHARTAAVLRSGYIANATPDNPDTMSVNLSSDRVRLALSLLEGIREGQSLGALLGYRFERGLHDDHGLAEVDKFIYPLRKAFPLVADALAPTQTGPDVPIEAIEARNVLDGRKLVAQIRSSGVTSYPFGASGLPAASSAEAAAIDAEADKMLDLHDAVADLALAEGVHQAVQGNFERVGATLDAYSSGTFPPDPEVVQTPAPGIGLTHRVALHLKPGLTAPAGATPRATVEPAVDAWLASVMPPLADVGCTVVWTDPAGGGHKSHHVTLDQLGLRPLDLIELVKPDDVQAMSELDDRILRATIAATSPRADAALEIRYQTAPSGKRSVFEAAALVRTLRSLVQRTRPLRASDATLQTAARPAQDASVFADRARVAGPKADLDTLAADFDTFLGTLQPLVADPVAHRTAIVTGIDGFLASAVALLERAARFGLPQSGFGFAYEWRRGALAGLMAEVRARVARWDARLAEFDTKLHDYDLLPAGAADADRFAILQSAEGLVQAKPDPLPPVPATLRAALPAKRAALAAKRQSFAAALTANHASFAAALNAIQALLPVDALDPEPFDLTQFGDSAVAFAEQLAAVLAGERAAIGERSAATKAALDAHDAAATPAAGVEALQAAAKALLGESFTMVPEFELSAAQGTEWAKAVAASTSGKLLQYLTQTAKIDHPVDEWLFGVARVRPMMHAWEMTVGLAAAFGRSEPSLVPMQLPYQDGAPWLALQFPDGYAIDSDRLLYTAHYATLFDPTARQCGLMLDEWTEVIPGTTKDTGVTFDFDRPDNEPPQAILVVTPASAAGFWQWDDLVGALHETLDLAKKRAVEPAHVDGTAYSRFLPATIMAVTLYGISITTALAAASGLMSRAELARHA